MLDIVISFATTTVLAWLFMLVCLWVLEKIALITGSDFFRVNVYTWTHSWKSWAVTAGFTLLCILAGA
jgi:hypothetical protein